LRMLTGASIDKVRTVLFAVKVLKPAVLFVFPV
jgi:hypothetical protein